MKKAFKDSIPVIAGYFPIGVVYGFVFATSGMPWFFAPLMSLFVYSGSIQLVALGLIAVHASYLSLLVTALLIGCRCAFYGLSLLDRYNPRRDPYLVFGLADTTYSIVVANPHGDRRYCYWLTAFIHSYWFLGTCTGLALAKWLPPFHGGEFVLTALFITLGLDTFFKQRQVKPFIAGSIGAAAAALLFPGHFLLVGIGIAACLLAPQTRRQPA